MGTWGLFTAFHFRMKCLETVRRRTCTGQDRHLRGCNGAVMRQRNSLSLRHVTQTVGFVDKAKSDQSVRATFRIISTF